MSQPLLEVVGAPALQTLVFPQHGLCQARKSLRPGPVQPGLQPAHCPPHSSRPGPSEWLPGVAPVNPVLQAPSQGSRGSPGGVAAQSCHRDGPVLRPCSGWPSISVLTSCVCQVTCVELAFLMGTGVRGAEETQNGGQQSPLRSRCFITSSLLKQHRCRDVSLEHKSKA